MNIEKSIKLHNKSKKYLVGGVNSPVRAFKKVTHPSIIIEKAKDAVITDIDGNNYFDWVMSYGPHLFGHANNQIISAIKSSLDKSSCFGMTSPLEVIWAEKLLKLFPYYSKVRALNSGTEATMTAIRLARGYTGKNLILKFDGHYHGHVDGLLVSAGSGVATLSEDTKPSSKGVPNEYAKLTKAIKFNCSEALKNYFSKFGELTAAVILEPIMGNMGVIPAEKEFMNLLNSLCKKYKCLLIFDEVMTGLRVSKFSAQGMYDIKPDLTCLGKVIGGGMPVSALLGNDQIMNHLSPVGEVYQAGTLSGNPIGMAAGVAMLNLIEEVNPYDDLQNFTMEFANLLKEDFTKKGIMVCLNQVGSMFSIFFRENLPKNSIEAMDVDHEMFNKFFTSFLTHGHMLPPSPYEAFFVSIKHLKHQDEIFTSAQKAIRSI